MSQREKMSKESDLILNSAYDRACTDEFSESDVTFQTDAAMAMRMKVIFREIDRAVDHCRFALDVGCGTGIYARELSKRSQRVIGIDLSLGMLKYARKLSAEYPTVDFLVADANYLPIKTDSIDVLLSVGVLQHFAQDTLSDLICEKKRVISRKNGFLFLETLNSSSFFFFIKKSLQFVSTVIGKSKDNADGLSDVDWYRFNPYWLERLLKKLGLTKTSLYGVFIFPGLLSYFSGIFYPVHKLNSLLMPLNHSFLITAKGGDTETPDIVSK